MGQKLRKKYVNAPYTLYIFALEQCGQINRYAKHQLTQYICNNKKQHLVWCGKLHFDRNHWLHTVWFG